MAKTNDDRRGVKSRSVRFTVADDGYTSDSHGSGRGRVDLGMSKVEIHREYVYDIDTKPEQASTGESRAVVSESQVILSNKEWG